MSLKNFKPMKKIIIINFLFLILCCHVPFSTLHAQPGSPSDLQPQGTGTTYFVAKNGNNNSSGLTAASAWATISKVNSSRFSPGDRILFKRGDTWKEQLLIPSSGSATGGSITFGAYGTGNKPVIDGAGVNLAKNHGLIRGSGKNYIIIENIRVQNSGINKGTENSGIGFYGGSYITVSNCEVYKTESAGIKMNANSNIRVLHNDVSMTNCNSASEQISLSTVNGFEVAYNDSYKNCNPSYNPPGGAGIDSKQGSKNGTIHHNNVWGIAGGSNGIYVDAYNADTYNIQVYSNYVRDIGAGGISIGAEQGGALHNVTVRHNIVENAKRGGIVFHNAGPTGASVYDIFIYNNTLYRNGTSGTNWYGGVRIFDQLIKSVTFKNNILSSAYNFQIGVDKNVSPSVVTLSHNVIYGVTGGSGAFADLKGTNTISKNPLFNSPDSNDFQLQAGSPAEDACDNSVWQGVPNIEDYNGVPITDSNGVIVAPGGRVNCGAYE
ncbi:right-handed parallel beta-helix repeat-containing protein [Desulfogranum marinum]|uniref:right-handed parallel beta-helix repeat-containing protein n=1 Tax=Desulfogranum marinum TaxID=453220 RepID=UPI0019634A31|nr:right-handed parallel beta-helix repeat-containing protein [Desulfogranum marinum]MBM9513115.1 right-handed parallel beta-helix repeat-containing protein [Desulfogranum marinum]